MTASGHADLHSLPADESPSLTLSDKAIRLSGHGEIALGYDHLKSRFDAQRLIHFALGIPTGVERCESCLLTYGFIRLPPFLEMLGLARSAFCAAHVYISSPDCCMSL